MAYFIEAGLDPKSIEFVEIPFPNMGQALANGEVDAVISSEPFVTIAKSTMGAERVLSSSEGLPSTSPISLVATSDKFNNENPDLVEDFRAAVNETMEYAQAHEDEVRAAIPTFTELEPDLANQILLAPIDTTDDPEAWDAWADLLVDVGAVDEKPNAEDAFIGD